MFVALIWVGFPPHPHPCFATQEEDTGYSAEEGAFVAEALAIHGNLLGFVEPYELWAR